MSLSRYIKLIAASEDHRALDAEDAHDLFAAILDGGASELEIGAVLTAFAVRRESVSEMAGFDRAARSRVHALRSPWPSPRPLVFGTYGGAKTQPNLLPLLALMLQRLGVPVLIHGSLEVAAGVACAYVLRELGILPCTSLAHAQRALEESRLAFVPAAVLCPALASLLALRYRLGVPNVAHTLVKLIDPFHGECIRVVGAQSECELARFEMVLASTGAQALLLRGPEGEPFADPRRRPRMLHVRDAMTRRLFEEETMPARRMANLVEVCDAATTARWIRQAISGRVPVPQPLVNQFACCLYLSGYAEEFNQAKAIAAVEAGVRTSFGMSNARGLPV
ncbi:MAG TPA: DNA-binding protein YbiB [Burkholderiales bacterium]|nr:DNA-binding protein YbiB [Burkholderiales bacterium]